MTDTNKPEISIYFKWVSCETDPRPYKPGKPVLEPLDVIVEVRLPLTGEYVSNVERIVTTQITNQKTEKPILTPKGMSYCIKMLEISLLPHENNFDELSDDLNTEETNNSNVDWEE